MNQKFDVEEFINKKLKFINNHLDNCKKIECYSCKIFYIKIDVYEELIFYINNEGLNESKRID